MPQNVRSKMHQQQSSLLLKKGAIVAVRRNCAAAYRVDEQEGPLTPVPTWKLYENPSFRSRSSSSAAAAATTGAVTSFTGSMDRKEEEEEEEEGKKSWMLEYEVDEADSEVMSTALQEGPGSHLPFLSARKLAASLWGGLQEREKCESGVTICDFSESSPCSHLQSRPLSLSNSESPDSADHQVLQAPRRSQQITKSSQFPPSLSPPLKAITLMHPNAGCIASQLQSSASKAANSRQISSPGNDAREEPGDLQDKYGGADVDAIASPFNFIKASNRSQAFEKTRVGSSLIECSLSEELKRALSKVHQVEAAQISARKEVDDLLRKCADEIITLRTKEKEKIQAAVLSIAEELDMERKARRNAEMENKRLAISLADANKVVLAAEKELEKERKARQLMEDVCDELAREIGEDKTEVEELKRELAKARDEIEEERKTLQVTEAWREERVQMKLSEAKIELEERCLALDSLKLELESFLNRGKAHRVEAFFDRGGETLRGAIERLQRETSESVFFLKDAKPFLSGHNDAMSSENVYSQEPTWNNNKGGLSMHVNAYDRNGIQQTIHSAEHGGGNVCWNVESKEFTREEIDWLESTNVYLNQHDKQWINHMRATRRRRGEAGLKSYGSKARGLSSMGDRGLGEDSFNNFEYRNRAGSDTESGGDYSSDCRLSVQEEGSWSADCDDDNGILRQRNLASWSASEVDNESVLRFSPKCGKKLRNRSLETMNAKGRHVAARVKKGHGGKSATRAEPRCDGDARLKSVFSQTKHHVLVTEDDSGLSSVTGYSPVYKSRTTSPNLLAPKRSCHVANPSKRGASLERRTVRNSVDWSKPYKRNSLQAKLLLEDRMSAQNFKLYYGAEQSND